MKRRKMSNFQKMTKRESQSKQNLKGKNGKKRPKPKVRLSTCLKGMFWLTSKTLAKEVMKIRKNLMEFESYVIATFA